MPDWTKSMQQTYEYCIVDPGTWKDSSLLTSVTSCSITRDLSADTLGSATIDIDENVGEVYIRTYLVTIQNGVRERIPLGTHLVQTGSSSFNGMNQSMSFDGYTPLLELKEKEPPLGFYVAEKDNVMERAYELTNEHTRAPVVASTSDIEMFRDFVANTDDTWITFLSDMIANAKMYFALDEMGRVLFAPQQNLSSMQPVWTYSDDNSSILYPDVTYEQDLYGIPNVVEVIYSDGNDYYHARVVNDDPDSIVSTVNRGREIPHRESNPSFTGIPTQKMVEEYATQLLQSLSSITCTVSYSHGYNGVRIGDCVRLNYQRADLIDVKARVTNQTIKCDPGCPVSEKAEYVRKLWR